MSRSLGVIGPRVALIFLAGWSLACAPKQPGATGQDPDPEVRAEAVDTLRGTIAVVGSEPATLVVIRPAPSGEIVLRGDLIPELRTLSGMDVEVIGTSAPPTLAGDGNFTVEWFAVRAIDGVPAIDGVVEIEDDVVYLRLFSGDRIRLAHPPAMIRGQRGAHIWIAGEPEGQIESFGLIRAGSRDR